MSVAWLASEPDAVSPIELKGRVVHVEYSAMKVVFAYLHKKSVNESTNGERITCNDLRSSILHQVSPYRIAPTTFGPSGLGACTIP